MRVTSLGLVLLALLGFSAARVPAADEYKVTGLDQYGNTDDLYSGFIPLSLQEPNDEGAFFFIMAKARRPSSNLVIWLNGGPACSSMVGFANENGPFTLSFRSDGAPGYQLHKNSFAWNEEATVVFVEQPIRTGFSLASKGARRIQNELEIVDDFYNFLKNLLTIFGDLQGHEVFITGESYAGMYIPFQAQYIVKKQAKNKLLGGIHINLVGVAIGNGAIDPLQDLSYSEYAYSHGLIGINAKKKIDASAAKCYAQIVKNGRGDCETMSQVLEAAGNPNEYDTGTFNGYTRITSPGGVFDSFFNDPNVQEALHVRGIDIPGINFVPESGDASDPATPPVAFAPEKWVVCNDQTGGEIGASDYTSSVPALKYLASAPGFRVLLYSGERDLNTNFLGTLHVLESSEDGWIDGQPWSSAKRALWRSGGDVAGTYQTLNSGKFSFLVVRNSGHLLPMDIPQQALDLLHRFLANESFSDVPLLSDDAYLAKHLPLMGSTAPPSSTAAAAAGLGAFALLVLLATFATLGVVVHRRKRASDTYASLVSVAVELPPMTESCTRPEPNRATHYGAGYQL